MNNVTAQTWEAVQFGPPVIADQENVNRISLKSQRLAEIEQLGKQMFEAVLCLVGSHRGPLEHDSNNEGKKKDLHTWCRYPHKWHTTLDSDIFTTIDLYIGHILKALEKYRDLEVWSHS